MAFEDITLGLFALMAVRVGLRRELVGRAICFVALWAVVLSPWMAYNLAHDVALPGSTKGGRLGFLMYPQAETAAGRRDSLDPDSFKYAITAREIRS